MDPAIAEPLLRSSSSKGVSVSLQQRHVRPLPLSTVLAATTEKVISQLPPPTKPPDLNLVSTLPREPPVPPVPPDPPPVPLSGLGLSPFTTSQLSPSLPLVKFRVDFWLHLVCSLPKFPTSLPLLISQVSHLPHPYGFSDLKRFWWLNESFALMVLNVWEFLESICVILFTTHLASVRFLTAICRFRVTFILLFPLSVSGLTLEIGWGLVSFTGLICFKNVITLPQVEDFTKLPQFEEATKLPRFEDVIELPFVVVVELPCCDVSDNGLDSFCILCLAFFVYRRNFGTREAFQKSKLHLQLQPQRYHGGPGWCFTDPDNSILSKGSATRRHLSSVLSSVLFVECLALKSALLAAYYLGYQHLCVFSVSLSLVTLLRSRSVINELKSILHDIYYLGDNFLYLSLFYVPRVGNHEADMTKSVLSNFVSFSRFGA